VWQRNELTTSHRGDPPTQLGCLHSQRSSVNEEMETFWLTNVIPEQIIFVSRGITVLHWIWLKETLKQSQTSYPSHLLSLSCDPTYNLKNITVAEQVLSKVCNTNYCYSIKTFTWFGRIGASHIWRPSKVSFTPSTNFSGVRTSPLTPSRTFTLSGNAPISGINYQFSLFVTTWLPQVISASFTRGS